MGGPPILELPLKKPLKIPAKILVFDVSLIDNSLPLKKSIPNNMVIMEMRPFRISGLRYLRKKSPHGIPAIAP